MAPREGCSAAQSLHGVVMGGSGQVVSGFVPGGQCGECCGTRNCVTPTVPAVTRALHGFTAPGNAWAEGLHCVTEHLCKMLLEIHVK